MQLRRRGLACIQAAHMMLHVSRTWRSANTCGQLRTRCMSDVQGPTHPLEAPFGILSLYQGIAGKRLP
jgi:hypothetical protein